MSTKPEFIIERISIKRNSMLIRYGAMSFIVFTDKFPYVSTPKHTRIDKAVWADLIVKIRDEWVRATFTGDTKLVNEDMPDKVVVSGRKVPRKKVK